MKKNVLILAVAACVLALGFALFACAPQQPSGEADRAAGGATEELIDTAAGEGLYQSDEQCLSCHGGSHEALAATTSDYGLHTRWLQLLRELSCPGQGNHRQ